MRTSLRSTALVSLCLLLGVLAARPAGAQGTRTDARAIAMGGGGGNSTNIAMNLVPARTTDAVIPIPLGLIQVFSGGFSKFNPTSSEFDPVRAVETTSNPLHYTFGAQPTGSPSQAFINDLVNGRLNPNLGSYAGFQIPESLRVQGLAAPQFGKTFKFAKVDDRFHGVFVGAGPYFSVDTALDLDPRLADLLANGTPYANTTMSVRDRSQVQLAMAITVGYRGRLALPGDSATSTDRDGVYVAYNFHVLRGFRYFQPDLLVRFDTNASGLLTTVPTSVPLNLISLQARSGSGSASDIGVQIVRGPIQGGFGVNGIGNKINWSDFTQTTYSLPNLINGFDFTEVPGISPVSAARVELPVVKTANVAYEGHGWGAMATVARGYNGTSAFVGGERQLGKIWLRGGAKHTRGAWDPTYGFGVGSNVALDVAFYGTRANLEGKRLTSMAISIRIKSPQ